MLLWSSSNNFFYCVRYFVVLLVVAGAGQGQGIPRQPVDEGPG